MLRRSASKLEAWARTPSNIQPLLGLEGHELVLFLGREMKSLRQIGATSPGPVQHIFGKQLRVASGPAPAGATNGTSGEPRARGGPPPDGPPMDPELSRQTH